MKLALRDGKLILRDNKLGLADSCCCNPPPPPPPPCLCFPCNDRNFLFDMPSRDYSELLLCADTGFWQGCPVRGNVEQSFTGNRDGYTYFRFISVQIFCGSSCPPPFPQPGQYAVSVVMVEVWTDDIAGSVQTVTAWAGVVERDNACGADQEVSIQSSSFKKEQSIEEFGNGLDFSPDTNVSWSIRSSA